MALPFLSTFLTPSTESKLCVIALEADAHTWYPYRFSAGLSKNEPWLNGAVERIEREIQQLEVYNIPRDRIMIGGFSQGACVAAKYVMTYPAKYWGIFILSGALPGLFSHVINSFSGLEQFEGVDLKGARIFVACGDSDMLVNAQAAEWTAWVLSRMGAKVEKRIYEGLMHSVCDDEKAVLKSWVSEMITMG